MLLCLGLALIAPRSVSAQSASAISEARIRADMAVLASDSFGGRKPGTPGERLTTQFIIGRLTAAGVAPANGGRWLQPLALEVRRMRSARLVVRAADSSVMDLSSDVAMVGASSPLRLVGLAVRDAGYVGEQEVVGKADSHHCGELALYRDADAPELPQPRPSDALTRLVALGKAGTCGALAIVADDAFVRRKAAFGEGVATLVSDPGLVVRGIIRESAVKSLLATPGPLSADVDVATDLETVTSHNVVGILRGAVRPDEYLLYTSHWDAFGRCRPGAADEICNGAIDNASGTAGLLELARAFASGPRLDRSVIFLFTTAEELGLAGSRQYARTPVVPLERTVAAFNFDVIAMNERGNTVGFVGAGLTDADTVFARLAAAQGRTLEMGPMTRMVLRSSDAWSLLLAGVPSFILSGAIGSGSDGNPAFREYLATRYHQPGDEVLASVPMAGAVEEVELLYAVGRHFGRAGVSVEFVAGSTFRRPGAR
jgi:hypothetical protein